MTRSLEDKNHENGFLDPVFFRALTKIESTYKDHDDDVDDSVDEVKNVNKSLASSCVITLCKILDNIIFEKKYNAKTRSIKLSNKLFKDKVGKVSGGVDFMMACRFTYDTSQAEKFHSIQLRKKNESRNALLIGRKCLDAYGQNILKLKVGKQRDEIPPFLAEAQIDSKVLEIIKTEITSLSHVKLNNLESEISAIIHEDSIDYGNKNVNLIHNGNISQREGFSPSTPDTEFSGDTTETERITNEAIPDTNCVNDGDMNPSNLAQSDGVKLDSETDVKNVKDVSSKGIGHDNNKGLLVIDDVVKNNSLLPIHELTGGCGETDIKNLSIEEKEILDQISKIDTHGMEEDDMILSVVDGKVQEPVEKQTFSFGLMDKLKQFTGRGQVNTDNEKEEEKEKGGGRKAIAVEDDISIVSYTTTSDIRIKETESLRLNYEATHMSPLTEAQEIIEHKDDCNYNIEDIKLGSDISEEDEAALKVGLNLFLVVLVLIFKDPASKTNKKAIAPLEIMYRLWGAILRSEIELNGIQTNSIFGAFRKISISEESIDDNSLVSLPVDDLRVCQFLCNTLCTNELIELETSEIPTTEEILNRDASFQSVFAHEVSVQYGEKVSQMHFGDLIEKHSKWHDIIVRGCNETLTSIPFIDISTTKSDLLSLWYAADSLPYHVFTAGHCKEAVCLLLDKNFAMHRYKACGYLQGTLRHLKDVEYILSNIDEENEKKSSDDSDDEDYEESALEAVHELILEILEEKKKEIDLVLKSPTNGELINESTTQVARDVGCALHHLGVSMGKIHQFQKEIDVYSEALRLKYSSKCSKTLIAETLLPMSICYRNLGDLWSAHSRCKELLSVEIMVHGDVHANTSKVLHHQGIILVELGDFDDALNCFEKSLHTLRVLGISSNEAIVKTLCWIGKVQREKGELSKALASFQNARSSLQMIVETENLDLAEIFQNIGVLYDDLGKHDKSLHYLYECLRIRRVQLGDDSHTDVCETLCFIASILRRKNLDKALSLLRMILNMKSKRLSIDKESDCRELLVAYSDVLEVVKEKLSLERHDKSLHEETATLFFKLGILFEKLHQYNDAVSYYNKSLKIRKIRREYKEVANILHSLGIAHGKRQSFKKAKRCFTDSLAIKKTILGNRHSEVAEVYHNLGNCAAKQGDFDKAAIYYEQSLIIKKLNYGDSVSTAKTIHTIGLVNEELGLLDDAFQYYEDALKIRMKMLGANDLDVAFSLHSVGTIHRKRNHVDKAHDCFTKSLVIKKQHYVVSHISIAETLHELAKTLSLGETFLEALSTYEAALLIYEKRLGPHKITASILDSIGAINFSVGKLDASYRYLERALVLKRMIFGNDDEQISNTMYLIGKVQGKSGERDDALESLKEALRIRKLYHSDESLPIAAVINDVGVLQLRKGKHAIARTCFTEAMRVWKLKLEKGHDYIGETLMNLAEIDVATEQYDDAIEKLNEALELMKVNHGDNHISVALIYFKLGLSLRIKNAHLEASDAFDRCLMIRSEEYGDDSMPVAEVLKNIGTLCFDMGEFAKARNFLGESLKIMNDKGSNDLEIADTLNHLGKVMMKMKYLQEAQEYFEEALSLRHRRIETEDSVIADIISNLAVILEERQKYDESLSMHGKALKIRKSLFGEHESIGDSYHLIGNIEQSTNRYQDALKSFGSALVVYQNTLGDDHLSCAKTMNNIGIVYEAMDECDEALKYHREALRIRKKNLGRDHLKVANSLDNIAGVYQKQKTNDKACSALKEALRIRISRLGNDHIEVATTLFGMGITYCDIGDLQRAMDCYEASLTIRKRKLGSSSIEVAQTEHNIGSLYAMKPDYQNALLYWRSALQKYRITLPDDHHMIACAIGNIQMAENVVSEGT